MSNKKDSSKDTTKSSEQIYILSEEQQKDVLLGLEQIKRGEFISNEELEKDDEWLAEE